MQNIESIQPLHNRILVRVQPLEKKEEKTASGLFVIRESEIQASGLQELLEAEVLAVGAGEMLFNGDIRLIPLDKGDKVHVYLSEIEPVSFEYLRDKTLPIVGYILDTQVRGKLSK